MKVLFAVLAFLLVASQSIAGPFGIDKGASVESLNIVKKVSPGVYYIDPPQKNTLFEKYLVMVSDSQGVYKIVASGNSIATEANGNKLIGEFNLFKKKLSERYGEFLEVNFLRTGSDWDESEDFMQGLLSEERFLGATWNEKYGAQLNNGIQSIKLVGGALKNDSGCLSVKYEFDNCEDGQKQI